MTIITSKRHPIKFYGNLLLLVLFANAMGIPSFYTGLKAIGENKVETIDYLLILAEPALLFLTFLIIRFYRKNTPTITISEKQITFDKESFDLNTVKRLEITGKQPFPFFREFDMEGIYIHFQDDTIKYIYDDMYSNTWEIKSFLDQTVIRKQIYQPPQTISLERKHTLAETGQLFKEKTLRSLRGIGHWLLTALFILLIINNLEKLHYGFLLLFGVVGILWFFMHGWFLHYFELTDHYFIVKNTIFFRRNQGYRIDQIQEIVFEKQDKQPKTLIVITSDFRTKRYPAAMLKDQTWLKLKAALKVKGIVIRNESIMG